VSQRPEVSGLPATACAANETSTSHGDASEDGVKTTLSQVFHSLRLLTVDACAAASALEIDLRLNDVLFYTIHNGLAVLQSEPLLRWVIHPCPLDGSYAVYCDNFTSDRRLDPHDKLHGCILQHSQ
jgi:hypothetical protein